MSALAVVSEEIECTEAESSVWENPAAYAGAILGFGIRRVMRDTRLGGERMAELCEITKTTFYRFRSGTRCKAPMAAFLWDKLAEIYLQYGPHAADFRKSA